MSNDSACGTQHEGVVSLVPAGCGARGCRDQAEETPPIPLISRSAKCGNGRDVPADHKAPGQEMHQKATRVRSRRRPTSNSREEIGPISHVASTAELGHGARSNGNCHFSLEKRTSQNWLLISHGKTHIPKNHGHRPRFRPTKSQQQRQILEIVEDCECEDKKNLDLLETSHLFSSFFSYFSFLFSSFYYYSSFHFFSSFRFSSSRYHISMEHRLRRKHLC